MHPPPLWRLVYVFLRTCTTYSGRSREGSMAAAIKNRGSTQWHAFENTYTTLILELRTSASTVATMHVCQLLYQEFYAHMGYVHINTCITNVLCRNDISLVNSF